MTYATTTELADYLGVELADLSTEDKTEINEGVAKNGMGMIEIEDMIDDFKKLDNHGILEKTFTQGYCYDFASILKRNYEGDIYFVKNKKHYVFKSKGKFYDITGKVKIKDEDVLIKDD